MSWCWCPRGSVGVRGYRTISVSSRSRDGGPPGALTSRGRPSEGRSNTRADQRRVERPGPPTPGGRRRSTRRTRERTSRCIRGGRAGRYPARSGGPHAAMAEIPRMAGPAHQLPDPAPGRPPDRPWAGPAGACGGRAHRGARRLPVRTLRPDVARSPGGRRWDLAVERVPVRRPAEHQSGPDPKLSTGVVPVPRPRRADHGEPAHRRHAVRWRDDHRHGARLLRARAELVRAPGRRPPRRGGLRRPTGLPAALLLRVVSEHVRADLLLPRPGLRGAVPPFATVPPSRAVLDHRGRRGARPRARGDPTGRDHRPRVPGTPGLSTPPTRVLRPRRHRRAGRIPRQRDRVLRGRPAPRVLAPNYIPSSVLTATRSTSNIASVLKPFYLEALASGIRGSGFPLTYTLALELLWGGSIGIVAAILFFRWRAPRWITHRVLILAGWVLAVFLLALGTFYVGITTDYRRFAYMLYPVTILGAAFVGDAALAYVLRSFQPRPPLPAPRVGARRRPLAGWRWRKWDRSQVALTVATIGTVGVLAFSAYTYTVPQASAFEAFFSGPGHDANFTAAMAAISSSNLSGSIYSASSLVDRWPSTLTARPVYEARPPTGYTYTPENLVQDELGNLLLDRQYTVTNGLVAGQISALDLAYFNSSPIYALDSYGVLRQVYEVPPAAIDVTLSKVGSVPVFGKTAASLPELLAPADPSTPTMQLRYNGSGFYLLETISTPAGTSSMTVSFQAVATGSYGVVAVSAKLSASSGNYDPVNQTGPSTFTWFTNTTSGNYTTYGSAGPGATITSITLANPTNGKGGSIVLTNTSAASNGSSSLTLTITTSTPTASNTITGFVGYFSGTAILAQWNVRFILLYNTTLSTGPQAAAFFQTVYGAVPFVQAGEWRVLVLSP